MSMRHVTKCQQSSRRVPIFIDGDKRPLGITLQFSLMINVRHPELLFLIWLWLTLYTCSFSHVHQYLVLYVAIKTKIQNQKKYVHVLYLSNNIIGTWKKQENSHKDMRQDIYNYLIFFFGGGGWGWWWIKIIFSFSASVIIS